MSRSRKSWWRRFVKTHEPYKVINGRDGEGPPLIVRYKLFSFPGISAYIHWIRRSDDTPDYHDHPWPFFHLILEGGYWEQFPISGAPVKWDGTPIQGDEFRPVGYWAFHRAGWRHRVELKGALSREAWSLVIVGPKLREWGFVDRVSGCWIHWKRYVVGERC